MKTQLNDKHGRVRIEAVRACSYLKGTDMQEAVLDVLNYDLDDELQYTLDETIRLFESQP